MKNLGYAGAVLLASWCQSEGAVLYDNTEEGSFPSYANADPGGVLFDDVLIPNARSNAERKLAIKKIEFSVFAATAGTYRLTGFVTQLGGIDGNGGFQIQTPIHEIFESDAEFEANQIKTLSLGDGISTLFEYTIDHSVTFMGENYNIFFFGLKFNAPLENVGWVTADGPDTNLNAYYEYFPGFPDQSGLRILNPPARSSFSLRVTGNPVPEPVTLTLAGLTIGFAGSVRRRLRR